MAVVVVFSTLLRKSTIISRRWGARSESLARQDADVYIYIYMRVSRKPQERFAAPCSMLDGAGRIRYRHVGITAETCVWTAEAAKLQRTDRQLVI
jgi:hypothetical protein